MNKLTPSLLAIAVVLLGSRSLHAGNGNGPDKGANFGALFYNGEVVGTVATPTSLPDKGVDVIYVISNGAEGQLGVTTVAPGDKDYHGGKWKVNVATWIGAGPTPLFTSAGAVHDAYDAGNLEIVRMPAADFVCPVQKNGPKS